MCTKRPNGVQENACFVTDRSQLKNAEDWLVTDVGSFRNLGTSARVFHIENGQVLHSEQIRGTKSSQLERSEGEYLVRNVYYRHNRHIDFLRTATTISDHNGEELQFGLVEYHFTDEEHPVSPHKNPRTGKSFVSTAPSTRKAIREKVKSHNGPSSIFDESVESTGGILHCDVMADMPRDIKQVKNACQNLKEKDDKDQFASLLDLSRKEPAVRNLQWTPSPRVVFCTDEQLMEIVEECCSVDSKSVLAIDTTYNVGDFYVTSTTYQSSKLVHSRTGKPAILPGPAMFHVRRAEKDFKYFCYSLLEINEGFEGISFLGGDRDKAQQGFRKPLMRSIFLPCKKHVEDDISRKLSDLGSGAMKDEVLKDIFGDDKNKEKGIVDSMSQDEFLAKVIAVTEKWDVLEKSNHPDKEPTFSEYFRANIEEDMKNGMLLSVRRNVGLDDEFFYNNGQECANFKYKSKIKEGKMQGAIGYRPNTKSTWVEAITFYQKMVEETNRNKQLAVLNKGPFVLSRDYSHLEVPLLKWSKMTQNQKQKHLAKVDSTCKKGDAFMVDDLADSQGARSATFIDTANNCNAIGNFDDFNLREFLRGTWKNASKIVELEGIGPFPNDENKRTVLSLSKPIVHTVQIKSQGNKFTCDNHCPRFKECTICAHTVAVAHQVGKLGEFVAAYEVPIGQMVQAGIPGGAGKKDNERPRKRRRMDHPARDVSQYGERVEAPSSSDTGNPYEFVFVKDTAATTCYGCKGRVRNKPSAPPPPPPYDLLIRHLEIRVYNRPGETKLRIATKPEMVYFHPLQSCVNITMQDVRDGKLLLQDDIEQNLNVAHKRLLLKEFGMVFPNK